MHIDLWHFEDFKGANTLVLSGPPAYIAALAEALEAFAASDALGLALEDCLPVVGFGQLWVLKEPQQVTGQFRWLVPAEELPSVAAAVRAIAASAPAHQYFSLVEPETNLLVTSGEYPAEVFGHVPNNSSKPTPLRGAA
ncbi:hypothetical protein [Lysobacter claricitrinus]|uniref:hypothetical protein n=1 Tax=Lysobacter claricitrinus TaxID=3367728 RepID=UPI0037DAD30A